MGVDDGANSAREPMLDGQAREPTETAADAAAASSSEPAAEPEMVPPTGIFALWRYLRPADRFVLFFAILGAVISAGTGPAMSFFMKNLFQSVFWPNDNGTMPPTEGPHEDRDRHVNEAVLVFLGLAAASFVAGLMAYIGFAHVADHMTLDLKRRFFSHLLQKEVGWYDTHSAASMSTRLTNDTYDFRMGTGEKMVTLITGLVMSPMGFVVAFVQDWRLTLMMLVAVPLMGGGFGMAMKAMSGSAAKQQAFYAKAGGVAETTLSSIRTVAAFGGYERQIEKYRKELAGAQRDGVKAGWCNGLSMGFLQISIYGFFALGFFAGAFLVIRDYNQGCWESDPPFGSCFTGPKMLSTLWAVLYGGIGLGQVAPGLATLTAAKAAAGRLYAVLDEPPAFDATVGEEPDSVQGSVEFKDVVFAYPSRLELPALSHASLSIPTGKTVAFVGPSGSGKSTAIALLQRFYDPISGSICFDGRDIRTLKLTWLRSKMALVQQEPVLFSGSIMENIAYGREGATSRDVEAAARAANAHTFITGFPDKYKTEVGERGVMMSGGQKQRVAIARAMVRNPAVLLLDEATSALDTESERVVQRALDSLMAQKARTTIVVAHRLSTVRNADQIYVLENGSILERGSHDELMQKKDSLYKQLVELQALTSNNDEADPDSPSSVSPNRRQLSRELSRHLSANSGASGLDRTCSGEAAQEAPPEAPPEDDEVIPVPTGRLWLLQKKDWLIVFTALLFTIPLAAARPFMGWLFADCGNLFSQPPATFDAATQKWVGAMDVDDLRSQTNWECLKFLALAVGCGSLTLGQLGFFRMAAERLTVQVRLLSFRAMLRQEVAWFDVRTSGHLADRLASEAPLIKSFTGEALAAVLQLFVTLLTGLGMAFYASWELTLVSFIFLPLMSVGQATMMRAMRRVNETTAGPLVSQAVGNIRTVASFSLADKLMKRYLALLAKEGAVERKKSRASGFSAAYQTSISFAMFGGIVYAANIFISNGWIPPDSVMQVLFPIMFAAGGAAQASQWSVDKVKAQNAVNHLFHTLDRTPLIDAYEEGGERPDAVKGEIEFRHVAFCYPSRPEVPVFTDFDLKIEPGTTVAFCGPSGSGKSTTIALLQRFYTPDEGSVCLDGRDISTLNLGWLRRQMALVQQEPVLFAGSVLENIAYGRDGATRQECEQAAEAANALSFINALPDGFATEVGERGTQLSGGQKQRIAIARSMVRDPAVLLLDEATSALDTESERVVQEALDRLLQQLRRTTLVIAHRLSTIANSDVICVIYQGQIVEKGTHAELMQISNGHYKKLASRKPAK